MEPLLYYDQKKKQQLRLDYPIFYKQLMDYIASLSETWFFVECYNPDGDGSRFSIILHDGFRHHLSISSTKRNSRYEFTAINPY